MPKHTKSKPLVTLNRAAREAAVAAHLEAIRKRDPKKFAKALRLLARLIEKTPRKAVAS